MRRILDISLVSLFIITLFSFSGAQPPTDKETKAEAAFEAANQLMDQKNYQGAYDKYVEVLKVFPEDSSILFNAGMAAFNVSKFDLATGHWKVLKQLEPLDWHVRAKLIQAYQALGKLSDVVAERKELFELRDGMRSPDLNQQIHYCRDQFKVGNVDVMAFEHFQLKGPRGVRYTFYILDKDGKIDYRISLGSYDTTNAVWHETTKPKPAKDERLFHLDGYFGSSHATYGMYNPEPTYDETKKMVAEILGKKKTPISATIVK